MKLILMAFSVVLLIACSEDSTTDKVKSAFKDVKTQAEEVMEQGLESTMEKTEKVMNEANDSMKEARAQGTKNRVPEAYSTLTMEG